MKAIIILLVFALASCQTDPEPLTDLSGTNWHWFEFNRGMRNKPVNHYLEFKTRGVVHYRVETEERGLVFSDKGTYELTGNSIVLNLSGRSDTIEYNGDKIYVNKSGEGLVFYMRVK